jgi:hypothetical protein
MRKSTMLLGSLVLASMTAFGCSARDDASTSEADQTTEATEAAAKANLMRVEAEIDKNHMANYGLTGALADQFIAAVKAEYAAQPELLKARMQTLASMVFFSAPQVKTTEAAGKITPFHGMDNTAFEALMRNEDTVFSHHMQVNGNSPNGVRPFSVCETSFMIKISKGEVADPAFVSGTSISNYDAYASAYKAFSASCAQKDLDEWYNFRGLGGLRPSWLESNLSDRFLRRMVKDCKSSSEGDCADWNHSRIGYRDRKNTELALREMVYDPRPETKIGAAQIPFGDYIVNPSNTGVLVEDRNGDGVGEWIASGPAKFNPGAVLSLPSATEFSAPAEITAKLSKALTIGATTLAAGTNIKLSAGSRLGFATSTKYDPAVRGPVSLTAVRLPPGTTLHLDDGTTQQVPYPTTGSSTAISGQAQAKLAAPLTFEVSPTWTPTLNVGRPRTGVLASNKFAGQLEIPITLTTGGSLIALAAVKDVVAADQVDPLWNKDLANKPDFGLMSIFSDGSGCQADNPSKESCPLLKRFFSLIDRHENFYQTYSGLAVDSEVVSQQPSPLVACSITLSASHAWDSAGTPTGGTAGFIYLMRVPFNQILSADHRSISTLGLLEGGDLKAGPQVATLENIYKGVLPLDMSKAWLDIATLSSNAYQSEHEVSKFGSVPAEQIEGILVVRLPARMAGGGDPGAGTPTDQDPVDHGSPDGGPPQSDAAAPPANGVDGGAPSADGG